MSHVMDKKEKSLALLFEKNECIIFNHSESREM